MNARRYPRTLGEAFKGPDYACALERPARTPYPRALWVALFAGFVLALIAGAR